MNSTDFALEPDNLFEVLNYFMTEEEVLIATNVATAGLWILSEILSLSKCTKANGILQSIVKCGKALSNTPTPTKSLESSTELESV
tara:strand:- start:3184 stop:3441 length:258 start_codon:yes stop_codon:yes gene_type:complete